MTIDHCDIVRIYNQLLGDKDIKKYYSIPKINNKYVIILPIVGKIYFNNDYQITRIEFKYFDQKLKIIYKLYSPSGYYSQSHAIITEEDVLKILKNFYI